MQQTFIVPYLRSSPIRDARRDLVIGGSDSLTLRVTVIEQDSPTGQWIDITGGVDGPQAQMLIWPDSLRRGSWDYGGPPPTYGPPLWTGYGTPMTGLGSFDFFLPAGALNGFPARCGWTVQLGWSADKSDVLFGGILMIMQSGRFGPIPPLEIPVLDDDSTPLLA